MFIFKVGCKNSNFSHNVPTDFFLIFFFFIFLVLGKFGLEKNISGGMNETQKGRGSVCGLMEFA